MDESDGTLNPESLPTSEDLAFEQKLRDAEAQLRELEVYWFSVNWTIAVRGWLREGDRLRRTSLDLSLWCRS